MSRVLHPTPHTRMMMGRTVAAKTARVASKVPRREPLTVERVTEAVQRHTHAYEDLAGQLRECRAVLHAVRRELGQTYGGLAPTACNRVECFTRRQRLLKRVTAVLMTIRLPTALSASCLTRAKLVARKYGRGKYTRPRR